MILTDYGDNSINFSLRVWTAMQAHTPLLLRSDLYFTLFKLFRENGIELPFPNATCIFAHLTSRFRFLIWTLHRILRIR